MGATSSTLQGLNSLTFNGGGPRLLTVTLPATGPLLPGPITFNNAPNAGRTLRIDTGGAGGANGAIVTQPGLIRAGNQVVLYRNGLNSSQGLNAITLTNPVAVNAAVGSDAAPRSNPYFPGVGPGPLYTPPPTQVVQERIVQSWYQHILGRTGSQAELDSWVAVLNAPGGSYQTVVTDIEGSFEAQDHLVQTWYAAYLGRQAQGGEELCWVNLLQAGWTEEAVLSNILGSAEFYGRAQALVPTGSPTQSYIQALYQVLLGRTASGAEVASWDAALVGPHRAGLSLSEAALAFLEGPEFRTDQVEGYYNALLGRPESGPVLDAWVGSGLDIHSIRIAFEAGPTPCG